MIDARVLVTLLKVIITAVGVNINQLATFDQPSSLTVTDSARIIICVCGGPGTD